MLLSHFLANTREAGCDEAGRGCLAGPVVAAAVLLPFDYKHPLLNDSKKLKRTQRDKLRLEIEREAEAWGIGHCSPQEIDEMNILKASFLAMHRAIDQLKIKPELLLIDGNRFTPYVDIPHHCIVKGDSKFLSIAAASILAKTYRDEWMEELAQEFPRYGWDKNAGYPTKAHREAIREIGPCHWHRMTFQLLPAQLSLFPK
jgi:ribonuclease HII